MTGGRGEKGDEYCSYNANFPSLIFVVSGHAVRGKARGSYRAISTIGKRGPTKIHCDIVAKLRSE